MEDGFTMWIEYITKFKKVKMSDLIEELKYKIVFKSSLASSKLAGVLLHLIS